MPDPVSFRQIKLLEDLKRHGVTVDDLARAWASMDGKLTRFDVGAVMAAEGAFDEDGTYHGYIVEMEEVLQRAANYAKDRKERRTG